MVQNTYSLSILTSDGISGNTPSTKVVSGLAYSGTNGGYVSPQTIGVAAPAQPVGTAGTSGSMTAGIYLIKVTYVNAPQGESLPSVESAAVTVSASGTLTVTSPAASSPATGYNVYITAAGGSSGTETKQNSTPIAIGTNYVQSAAVSSGASLPGSNSTLIFTPTFPATPIQSFYIRNTMVANSGNVASITWTPQGGSSNKALDLVPQAAILFCEPSGTTTGGITALSITVNQVQSTLEMIATA